jgi:uncharacterized surface protein with fasciclin (FAS1) repeats
MTRRLFAAAVLAVLLVGVSAPVFAHPLSGSPLRPVRVPGTIVDIAVATPDLSTLVSAVTAANLVETLQGKGPFTVFAPTNKAFAKLPPDILNYLLSNKDELTKVLLYHVASGRADLRSAILIKPVKTVQGQKVFARVTVKGSSAVLTINNSKVVLRPIIADNGWIYVIDSVLLPQYR